LVSALPFHKRILGEKMLVGLTLAFDISLLQRLPVVPTYWQSEAAGIASQ
jgi:hypothetical protein